MGSPAPTKQTTATAATGGDAHPASNTDLVRRRADAAAEPEPASQVISAIDSGVRGKPPSGKTPTAQPGKKRKSPRGTASGKRPRRSSVAKPKTSRKVTAEELDPTRLTMRELIRRAEALERKGKEEVAKKLTNGADKGAVAKGQGRSVPLRPPAANVPPAALAPQVQIVDGRIVINAQSLVVGAQASTQEDTDTYHRVEENTSKLNYNTYANIVPKERWREEDTELFYKALQRFGTDFALIQQLFPGRTRQQVKSKFKKEEKLHPVRLAHTLAHKAEDQSHHYKTIIDILKPEGGEKDDDVFEPGVQPSEFPGEGSAQKDDQVHEEVTTSTAAEASNMPTIQTTKSVNVSDMDEASKEVEKIQEEPAEAAPPMQSGSQPSIAGSIQPQVSAAITQSPKEKANLPEVESEPAPKPARKPLFAYRSTAQPPSANPLSSYKSRLS